MSVTIVPAIQAAERRAKTPRGEGIEFTDDVLLAARAVVESAILRYAQIIPDEIDMPEALRDDLTSIVNLSEVAARLGRVGDPPRHPDDDWGVLGPEEVATLVTEARWEVVFNEQPEETWDANKEGFDQACAVALWRAGNARRVLDALGVEPGNPSDLEQEV